MINILYLHAGAEMYGADKVLLELIRGLDKSKFCPYVVLPCEGVLAKELSKAGAKVSILDYPILRRKFFKISGIINYFFSYFAKSRKLAKYARENNIHIIHNNTTAVLEGIYLKYKLSIPLVWHVHEIIVSPRIIYKLISFLLAKYSNLTICVSNAVRQSYIDSGFFNEKKCLIYTIYNGIDSAKYIPLPVNAINSYRQELNIPQNAQIVGMIGRINAWKGQLDFLDSMNHLLEMRDNLYAILVGSVFSGEEWRIDELKLKISNLRYKERIILLDFQSDTVKLYNLFDIFVLPSINPDPLPTVVLEAMACKKPIVGYKHGGITEMIKDNGILVAVRDKIALGEAIEKLLDDKALLDEMASKSRLRQNNAFSLQSYINNFEKAYTYAIKKERA